MAEVGVRIEGLREFSRELKKADAAFPREMRQAGLKVARFVADRARARFSGRPGRGHRSGQSLKAGATQSGAYIKGGGPSTPTFFGDEFGARTYRQFPPFGRSGYALYPTIGESREETGRAYLDAVEEAVREAFPG